MRAMRRSVVTIGVCMLACLCAAAQQDAPSATPAKSPPPVADSNSPSPTAQPATPRERPELTPDAAGKLSQEQMHDLTRVVAQNYRDNYKKQRNYTYIERDVEKSIGGNGQAKSTEIKTYEIVEIYGEQVRRLIEKDDKPLDAKEAAKEEERIQEIVDKHKNESEEDRKKRLEKEAKRREESSKFVTEVADSHDFRLIGTELVDGREAWVIDGEPRPSYEPQDNEAKFVSKFRGRLWIDKDDLQLAKMDIEAVDTASVG